MANPDPITIRSQLSEGQIKVRAKMPHIMETGLRRDKDGYVIPAWYITEVSASLNGEKLFTCDWSIAVAKDPILQFTVLEGKVGDTISITWVDTKGETRTDSVKVEE